MKKYLLGSLAVFIAWSVLDYVIHGMILGSTYEATKDLWRPMEEMNMGLMRLVCAVGALAFTAVYAYMIKGSSVGTGLKYGVVYGIGTGFAMGFGSYGYIPIPYSLAWGWFLASLAEAAVGGLLVGWIVKPSAG